MTVQPRSDDFRLGETAGRDIDVQVADCPFDHDDGQFERRQEWLAGFAEGRRSAAPAEDARDYRELDAREQVPSDLPVYIPG